MTIKDQGKSADRTSASQIPEAPTICGVMHSTSDYEWPCSLPPGHEGFHRFTRPASPAETTPFEELVEDWEFCFRLSLISPENQVLAYNAQTARQSLIDVYKKQLQYEWEWGEKWMEQEIKIAGLEAELSCLRALVLTAEQANAVLAWCYNSLPTADLSSQSRDRNYGLAALRRMANEADPAHSAPAWSEADV